MLGYSRETCTLLNDYSVVFNRTLPFALAGSPRVARAHSELVDLLRKIRTLARREGKNTRARNYQL
jgi:hypothetical protein